MDVEPRLLSVPNVSEGSDPERIDRLRESIGGGVDLLDEHSDVVHNRTVFTLAGDDDLLRESLLRLASQAVAEIDLDRQHGAHPRIGALDVCPIVYLSEQRRLGGWALARSVAEQLGAIGLPVFLYGELATSPERAERAYFRAGGHVGLARRIRAGEVVPDFGPARVHPTAGAVLVTARPPLAAFNVLLAPGATAEDGRAIAASLRESGGGLPGVRAIAVVMEGGRIQISTNVHDPLSVPLAEVVAAIGRLAAPRGTRAAEAELVGLIAEAALAGYPEDEIPFIGADVRARTIEARLRSIES